MKNLKIHFFILLIVQISCLEKENLSDASTYKFENYASFETESEFNEITNKISSMTDEDIIAWESRKGFESYRSVYSKAISEWDLISSDEGAAKFAIKYKDILTIQDSTLVPSIEINVVQSIVNRQGVYETQGFINRIEGEYVLSVHKKNITKLQDPKKIVEEIREGRVSGDDGVRFSKYISEGDGRNIPNKKSKAACTTNMVASYFYNQSNCRNDREVFISARSYIDLYTNFEGDWRQPRVEIKVWGKLRTGTFCVWNNYQTTLAYRNVDFSIMAWEVIGQTVSPKLFQFNPPDYAPTNDRLDLFWNQPIGNRVLNQLISPAAFTTLHAEGTSRGVNGNWAIIDCR